jgi:hypothetical protein
MNNNDKTLRAIERVINHYSVDFKRSLKLEFFSDTQKNDYLFYLSNIISKLGDLSEPLFNLQPKLKKYYLSKYGEVLGQDLFQMKYSNIHKNYDRLKDMAHNLYEEIETTPVQVYF